MARLVLSCEGHERRVTTQKMAVTHKKLDLLHHIRKRVHRGHSDAAAAITQTLASLLRPLKAPARLCMFYSVKNSGPPSSLFLN